ncbi:PepSY-associated TM helix domain-containing protein [Aquisediminimonas sediminicola]|uniref:PepSY-associated TM helix domain-containing protein n=1 Tax=Alteraquisediminimonas sediminicola TaxID=2676787 RepID=UPI001C8E1CFD|nr:PepSY domain-containing protein [Aquisediminimonas sediminicola]
MTTTSHRKAAFYRMIWRWHFYAGLFVIPFILMLSLSGALYLFKPQVERWEERAYQQLPTTHEVSPNVQLDAALAAFPHSQFHSYRLPERVGDAAMIHLALADGIAMRDVFVSPQGRVLGSIDPESRIMAFDHRLHGQLLIGQRGSWLVELAASWAIVMVVTGLYLWWPRGRGLAGVLWPRLSKGSGIIWRDLHAVTGFWVAGLALVLLLTGLPWADVWGSAFKSVRAEMGWVKGRQDWTIGGKPPADDNGGGAHAEHDHQAMMRMAAAGMKMAGLADIVAKAKAAHLAFPVLISPPGAAANMAWTVKSDSQNRPQRISITYDMATGNLLSREGFADKHVIDRVIGYGVAWHEGQLFGPINQLIGVLTAAGLVLLSISGFVMWRRRKPAQQLGAPPLPHMPPRMGGVMAIIFGLAALLPLLAASLLLMLLFDLLILPRLPGVARWLGMKRA